MCGFENSSSLLRLKKPVFFLSGSHARCICWHVKKNVSRIMNINISKRDEQQALPKCSAEVLFKSYQQISTFVIWQQLSILIIRLHAYWLVFPGFTFITPRVFSPKTAFPFLYPNLWLTAGKLYVHVIFSTSLTTFQLYSLQMWTRFTDAVQVSRVSTVEHRAFSGNLPISWQLGESIEVQP